MTEWQTGKPPHREIVEVEDGLGGTIRVCAIWGGDGVLPHWRAEDYGAAWGPSEFQRWRRVSDPEHGVSDGL